MTTILRKRNDISTVRMNLLHKITKIPEACINLYLKDKTSKKDLNETDINGLPQKKFKIMVINVLTKVRRTMHVQSKNFNKERI